MLIVTALGDVLVLLPASLALIAWLAACGAPAQAAAYARALFFCLSTMFALKFAFAVSDLGWRLVGINSPSGHVAFATTFYGALGLWLSERKSRRAGLAIRAALAAPALAVAVTRYLLHVHSPREIFVGALVGVAALAIFEWKRPAWTGLRLPLARVQNWGPVGAVYTLALLLLANRWTAEGWIDGMATRFGAMAGLSS